MRLPDLMCRYAERFAALGSGEHHVASPLGAWLVLALAGPAASGELAKEIEDALGTDIDSAHRAAKELLAHPHPAVPAAVAAWRRDDLPGLNAWLSTLPAEVETGPIPTQGQADSWAREHTLGLIDRFPVGTSDLAVLLVSALATRVTWMTRFDTADAADLRGPWSSTLHRVLRASRLPGHDAYITETERAGRVAVHSALADGLVVTSVIAEATAAPGDVLAAAHDVAVAQAQDGADAVSVSLFDLPLGDHALWTITEEEGVNPGEHVDALLPAWHADSAHDLASEPKLGFVAAGQALQQLARLKGPIDAKQTAIARYGRRGFEAAAVTHVAMATSARRAEPSGLHRTATLRFGHPYAVVATAHGTEPDDPWEGLPVFSAWISEPEDAQE